MIRRFWVVQRKILWYNPRCKRQLRQNQEAQIGTWWMSRFPKQKSKRFALGSGNIDLKSGGRASFQIPNDQHRKPCALWFWNGFVFFIFQIRIITIQTLKTRTTTGFPENPYDFRGVHGHGVPRKSLQFSGVHEQWSPLRKKQKAFPFRRKCFFVFKENQTI